MHGGRTGTPSAIFRVSVRIDHRPDIGGLCQAGSIVDITSVKSVQTIDQFMSKLLV